jgi:hypothetical protein
MINFTLGLLADNAHADQSGKLYVLGEFTVIVSPTLPARHPQFYVVARWVADIVDIRDTKPMFEIEIVDEDGRAITPRSPKLPLPFGPIGEMARGKAQAQVILQFNMLMFPKYGTYTIHFRVNDNPNGAVTLYVADRLPGPPAPNVSK